jgi:hypothetical protein
MERIAREAKAQAGDSVQFTGLGAMRRKREQLLEIDS